MHSVCSAVARTLAGVLHKASPIGTRCLQVSSAPKIQFQIRLALKSLSMNCEPTLFFFKIFVAMLRAVKRTEDCRVTSSHEPQSKMFVFSSAVESQESTLSPQSSAFSYPSTPVSPSNSIASPTLLPSHVNRQDNILESPSTLEANTSFPTPSAFESSPPQLKYTSPQSPKEGTRARHDHPSTRTSCVFEGLLSFDLLSKSVTSLQTSISKTESPPILDLLVAILLRPGPVLENEREAGRGFIACSFCLLETLDQCFVCL